jgi:hypothetical protein
MLIEIPGINVWLDKEKVLAIFVDRPDEYQKRIVVLFKDGERKVVVDDISVKGKFNKYFSLLKERFNHLNNDIFPDLICKKELIEFIQIKDDKLLVKIASHTLSLHVFNLSDFKLLKKDWGSFFLPHFYLKNFL